MRRCPQATDDPASVQQLFDSSQGLRENSEFTGSHIASAESAAWLSVHMGIRVGLLPGFIQYPALAFFYCVQFRIIHF